MVGFTGTFFTLPSDITPTIKASIVALINLHGLFFGGVK
jgi:hypothetical protein